MNKNPQAFQVHITSVAQYRAITEYYKSLGFNITLNEQEVKSYPFVVVYLDQKSICANSYLKPEKENGIYRGKLVEFKDAFFEFDPIKLVNLNAQYTAEVSKTGIKVGCQVFPLDVIDKLVKARDEINFMTSLDKYDN